MSTKAQRMNALARLLTLRALAQTTVTQARETAEAIDELGDERALLAIVRQLEGDAFSAANDINHEADRLIAQIASER